MRVNLSFEPEALTECPSCGAEVTIECAPLKGSCPECNYHAGSDFAAQWQEFCDAAIHGVRAPEGSAIGWITQGIPAGCEVVFAHEGEPDDYYFDVKLEPGLDVCQRGCFIAWLDEIDAESCDIEPADIAALTDEQDDDLIDALAEILDVEGWGGREHGVKPRELASVVAERLEWLRGQKVEGGR